MASQEMTLREVCLADHYDQALAEKDKRIAELEADHGHLRDDRPRVH